MKVGLLVDPIKDKPTGVSNYTEYLAGKLVDFDKKNNYVFIDYKKNNFNKNNLLLISNPFKFLRTYLWHNLMPLKIRNLDLDVIFNFHSAPHWFGYKQKEVFLVYDLSWYHFPQHHPLGRVVILNLFFRKSLSHCYKIIVDSQDAKNDLIKTFNVDKDKIFVIYPPIPKQITSEKKPNFKIDFPYILYVGTLEPRKNIKSILLAYKKLKTETGTKHKLIICGGKGWKFDSIFQLTQQLKLENDVIFTGYVTDEEKKYLLTHSDFFVYPSFYEGFGIPLLEAMMYGSPIITSNVSSLPEVVEDAALLVDPYKEESLMSAMKKLIGDKKLKNELRKRGFKRISELKVLNDNQIKSLLLDLKT